MQLFVFLFLVLFYFLFLKPILMAGKDAPFVPMDTDVAGRIINSLHLDDKDIFYDLGSGDGRFVILAAMKGAKAYGVEMDRFKVFYSRLWLRLLRLGNKAQIIHGDVFEQNYSDATVINCYLLQEATDNLEKKFSKELKAGTKVVSTAFPISEWKPKKVDPRGTIYGPVYYYEV